MLTRTRPTRIAWRPVIARLCAMVLIVATLVLGPVDDRPAAAQGPQTFLSDPALAGGVNGPVWTSELVGDELWVGGEFTSARNYTFGSAETATTNLAVININTGEVVNKTFNFDGPVYALSYHDGTVWAVGNFDHANDKFRQNIVALDAITGEIIPEFRGASNAQLRDVEYHNGWLYLAGNVSAYNGVSTGRVLRVNPTNGSLDAGWNPGVVRWTEAIDTHGDHLIAAERISTLGGEVKLIRISTGQRIDGFDPTLGTGLWDAAFSPSGDRVYSASLYNVVYAHTITDRLLWSSIRADGDIQAVAATDSRVYAGFHEGWRRNMDRRIVALYPHNGQEDTSWYVEMNSYWGVRDIEIYDQGLVAVGEFSNVNGINARRVAIFRPVGGWNPAEPLVPPNPPGDVDCDMGIDTDDSFQLLEILASQRTEAARCPLDNPATSGNLDIGDVDDSGEADITDAMLIAQCEHGVGHEFCSG